MKNVVVLFLSIMTFSAYSQKEAQSFCDGNDNGKYFPLNINKKKILWNDTYYFESIIGQKEFDGKLYIEFKQEYKNGEIDLVYFREEKGVIYEYRERCKKEYIKLECNAVGQQWSGDCLTNSYKIIAFDGKLKTPYCQYRNLLVIEAAYENETFTYYYLKGYGYVAATKQGKLYSCAVPESKDPSEQNPFAEQNAPKEQNQSERNNPFSKQNLNNTFAVKGIAYPNYVGGYGGMFGLEKGFARNQSFGVKYSYDLATPHREDSEENGSGTIDHSHNKNLSFILEYKYYFNFKFLAERNWSPYISLSLKSGTKTLENDRDYPHNYYYREIKYDIAGPGLGTLFVLDDSGKWTIDTQISYLIGKKKVTTEGIANSESSKMDKLRLEILVAYNINW
jgi:hypothetical protein